MKKMKVLAIAIFVLCTALFAMTVASADQGQVQPGIYTPDYDITKGVPVWRPTEFMVHADIANKVVCFGI